MLAKNKKAYFNYEILETLEAGIVLNGSEVKSITQGQVNMGEGFIRIMNGEIWLLNVDIPKYRFNTASDYNPTRNRKLLVKKGEIYSLESKAKQGGLTIVPLKMYVAHGKIKVEIGLAKGKKMHEKRARDKERQLNKDLHREKRAYMVK